MPTHRIPNPVMNAHMQEHGRTRVLMKCRALLIARAGSSELTNVSLIKCKVMGGAHRAISIHVDSSF